jgi:hypothetical protein
MREFGARFVPLGEIAEVRRGITSGCDAFFMPRDITRWALETFQSSEFKKRYGLDRFSVETGAIKIIRAGDGSEHPIETAYLKPEVHSLMTVERPLVRAAELDRVVLLAGEPLTALEGSWVARYLRYGETHAFESRKSKPVPVPKRSTVAARRRLAAIMRYARSLTPSFKLPPPAMRITRATANPRRVNAPRLSDFPDSATITQ